MNNLEDLYRRVIMDHYKRPHNRGELGAEAISVAMRNPTCGDAVTLQLAVQDDVVQEARWTGEGCSISMASVSMMTDAVRGKTVAEALAMVDNFSHFMQGEDEEFEYEDIEALSGVTKFPARIKCAMLGWNALRKGLEHDDADQSDQVDR
jgi:nitrogen fixation NifU-like protein